MDPSQGIERADAPEAFEVVHARVLRRFPELVAELGGDLGRILKRACVEPGALAGESPAVTYRQLVELLEAAAEDLGCGDFGLRLALRQGGPGMFGPLGQVMKNSRTFGEALDYVSSHTYAHSLAARVRLTHWPEQGLVFSGHDILLDRLPNRAQAVEQILLAGHLAAVELTGGHARVRRVHLRHQPVSKPADYRRYFGCEVRFGQAEDGVAFSLRDLACPIVAPDAAVLSEVTAYIERRFTRRTPPTHAEARGAIMRLLWSGGCSNEQVAAALNLHPRALHRRLREEGSSFQKVKDEVRGDVMLYYLQQTDLDFTRISEKLGFAEQSVMTRCCQRWFARTPTQLRRKSRARG